MQHLSEHMKLSIDVVSTLIALGSFLTALLPALASLLSIIWAIIRLYEWWKGKKKNGDKS